MESEHNPHHFKTTDFASEYDGMLLQTGYVDHWNGGHHSKYWKDRINDQAMRTNADWRETFAQAEAEESTHNPDHYKTVNFEDEYNGMLLQTGEQFTDHWAPQYKHHSNYWKDRVHDDSKRINGELRESLAEQSEASNPHNPSNYKTVDLADEYNGMLL
jgi:hypothetical protein